MTKLVPLIILIGSFACTKKRPQPAPETAASKKVEYHIFAAKDYSHPSYANIKANLRLQIRKINYKTGEMELLWDSVFAAKNITDFPQYANKIIIQKFYPVYESKEKLNGSYSVKYDDNGFISQEGWGDDVVPGEMSTLIEADL
jgi:hypothetical protein